MCVCVCVGGSPPSPAQMEQGSRDYASPPVRECRAISPFLFRSRCSKILGEREEEERSKQNNTSFGEGFLSWRNFRAIKCEESQPSPKGFQMKLLPHRVPTQRLESLAGRARSELPAEGCMLNHRERVLWGQGSPSTVPKNFLSHSSMSIPWSCVCPERLVEALAPRCSCGPTGLPASGFWWLSQGPGKPE